MGRVKIYNEPDNKTIIDLYNTTGNNISEVARQLKVSRSYIATRIAKDEELKAMVTDANESMVDLAEEGLKDKLYSGDLNAIMFVLKTKGKDRGYGEKAKAVQVNTGKVFVEYMRNKVNVTNEKPTVINNEDIK